MNLQKITNNVTIDNNECWLWTKSLNSAGYGQLTVNKKYWLAHRYAYTCLHGTIPEGYLIRHMCQNSKCCNPKHLKLGKDIDNYHDSKHKHVQSDSRRRKIWVIGNVKYNTCREASKMSGISISSIIKYTHNGIFDIMSYRNACFKARVTPKV